MIRGSSKLYHNVQTATSAYTELEAFKKLAYCNNVNDLSIYTHQLRWIKSPSELKLMKESASIACQVRSTLFDG
jgi:Xaa-Pro aminopeptidase